MCAQADLLHLKVNTPQCEIAGCLLAHQMGVVSEVITAEEGRRKTSCNHVISYVYI